MSTPDPAAPVGAPPQSAAVTDHAARAAALDKALRTSEIRYRRLFETAQDGILLLNADTAQIEDVNPYLIKMLAYSRDEFLGKKLWEISAFKDTKVSKEYFAELQALRYIRYDDLPLETKDGRHISVEYVSNVYDCDGVDVIQCNIRDNTSRHLAEMALVVSARILRVISASNAALVESGTESVLLSEYCRIIVEVGGHRMAWIGFADPGPDKRVVPMAHYGPDEGYLALADITWAETARGRGPVGRALRTGKIQFTDDIAADPTMGPWHVEAAKRGYRSSIVVPFRHSDGANACLTIYSAVGGSWTEAERQLLQEIVADLAFGITALHTAIVKAQYEESLRISLEQTVQVIADTMDQRDSYTAGHQRRVANLCSGIARELGLSADRIHGLHLAATIHDLGKIGIPAEILAKPARLSAIEFNLVKEHVNLGYDIIKDVRFPWPIARIVREHHERIDGSGYPQGLKGDVLLLESRILAVADVVEAMASHRPYRSALGIDVALGEIIAHRGTAFDPEAVDACVRLFREQGYAFEN